MSSRHDLTRLLNDPGSMLDSADDNVRRIAVATAARHDELQPTITQMLTSDPAPTVRRECAEALGRGGTKPRAQLELALHDEAAIVREAAVTALGELADPASVDPLIALAGDGGEDKLVREAAVAALGAIGDDTAVPILLTLIESGPPQIRRRCVPALSVFDGESVEAALRSAAGDRNPMVREAAEMVVGRSPS